LEKPQAPSGTKGIFRQTDWMLQMSEVAAFTCAACSNLHVVNSFNDYIA
jgi:hypothetical protein